MFRNVFWRARSVNTFRAVDDRVLLVFLEDDDGEFEDFDSDSLLFGEGEDVISIDDLDDEEQVVVFTSWAISCFLSSNSKSTSSLTLIFFVVPIVSCTLFSYNKDNVDRSIRTNYKGNEQRTRVWKKL